MSQHEFDEGPWYKQFWLWFMLIPLGILVLASFYLLYKAVTTHDGVVVDNFYRDGKGYAVRYEEDAFARNMNLQGDVRWQDQSIRVSLSGELSPLPELMELLIIFPTNDDFDVTVNLQHRGLGEYVGTLPESVAGKRHLQLHPLNVEQEWRLHATDVTVPPTQSLVLLPKPE